MNSRAVCELCLATECDEQEEQKGGAKIQKWSNYRHLHWSILAAVAIGLTVFAGYYFGAWNRVESWIDLHSGPMLRILTFLGIVVGFIGSLISQLTKENVDVEGTVRKRLTSAGRWSLVISLLGFATSFASETLKSSLDMHARIDDLARETRLLSMVTASGTPLNTVTVQLTVDDVPEEIRRKITQGIKEAKASPTD
jgi:hypothetical protein